MQTISFSYKILYVSLLITDYLIRLAFGPFQLGFSMWLGVGPKGNEQDSSSNGLWAFLSTFDKSEVTINYI